MRMARRNGEAKRRMCARPEKTDKSSLEWSNRERNAPGDGSGEHARPGVGVHGGVRVAAGGVPPCQQVVGPGSL